MAAPFSLHPGSGVLSIGTDTDYHIWALGWDVHALTHRPWALFDANIFYPLRHTLAFSENVVGSAVLAAPVIWVTGDPMLAANLVSLLSIPLSALGAWLLARRLGLSAPAAFVCGLVFGFTPPRFLRLDQFHLTTIEWMPFCLAYLHGYFATGARRDLRLAAAFFGLQALTSGHGAAMLVLAIALLLAERWLHGEPVAPVRRLRDLGWVGAALLVPVALVYLPYRAAQREVGLRRALDDWSVSASSFFTSTSHVQTWIVAHLPDWPWLRDPPDSWLFPGFLPLVLAGAAFALGRRRTGDRPPQGWWPLVAVGLDAALLFTLAVALRTARLGAVRLVASDKVLFAWQGWPVWLTILGLAAARVALRSRAPFAVVERLRGRESAPFDPRGYYAVILLVCFWLAVGPPIGLWQWVYWLPGLNFVRAPSRFLLLGVLALAVLAAIGVERLFVRRPARAQVLAAAAVSGLLLAEFAALPFPVQPYRVDPPGIDRWLDTQPKPFAVVEMPVPDSRDVVMQERSTTRYMLHSLAHYQPIVQGYSGIQPPGYARLRNQLVTFPDEPSLRALIDLGVTYAVFHADLVPPSDRPAVEARYERYSAWLTLESVDGDGRAYKLHYPVK